MSVETKIADAIGIDLGTTYCCCAVFNNGVIEVIPNLQGKATTPSVVAFDDNGDKIVGDAAMIKKTSNPNAVLFDSKRLIGRRYDDQELKKYFDTWSFNLVRWEENPGKDGGKPTSTPSQTAVDNIRYQVGSKYYAPVQLSAFLLMYCKESAELKLNRKIEKAVITVPAHFKDAQRHSTQSAATIAGFTTVRLLNEPTAAAMAYGFKRSKDATARAGAETVLVFDFGGGTFDVSCLKFEPQTEDGGVAETCATEGDTLLGGRDFDHEIYIYCMNIFCEKNKIDKKLISDKSKRRLRIEVEKAKRILSTNQSASVEVDYFHKKSDEDIDLSIDITRPVFDEMCEKYFTKAMERVKGCLMAIKKDASCRPIYNKDGMLTNVDERVINEMKNTIDKVLLVGGSSRIPYVQKKLSEMFGDKKVCMPVHPDEAVAIGAAFHAASIFSPDVLGAEESLLLIDTVPLDIGCEVAGGVMAPIISANSSIPIQQKKMFTTYSDNQTSVMINIYEGNRTMVADNNLLGRFSLDGIPPAPRGVPQIEIACDINHSGCLKITAKDTSTSNSKELIITDMKGKLSPEDIERMRQEAEMYKEQDKIKKDKVEKRNEYDSMVFTYKKLFTDTKNEAGLAIVKEHESWLINNNSVDLDMSLIEERIKKLNEEVLPFTQGSAPGQGQAPNNNDSSAGPEVEEVN